MLHRFIIFLLLTISVHAKTTALDERRFLAAIAAIEGHTGIGPHGEMGPYAMTACSRRYTGGHSHAHALLWLHYLRKQLTKHGVDDNVWNLAMAWNCAVETVVTGRAPISTYHYARRVDNYYTAYAR